MIHPKDNRATNPRIKCVVCGQWKRLHLKKPDPLTGLDQTFYGGCRYSGGGDHLAGKDGDNDVCERCCHVACKAIAEQRQPATT